MITEETRWAEKPPPREARAGPAAQPPRFHPAQFGQAPQPPRQRQHVYPPHNPYAPTGQRYAPVPAHSPPSRPGAFPRGPVPPQRC
jgi:hypothetical protein